MGVSAMRRKGLHRAIAFLAAAGLIASACGGGGDSTSEPADSPAEETTSEPAEEPAAEEPAVEAGDEAEGDVDTEVVEDDTVQVSYGGSISVGLEAEATGLRPWEDNCASPCYNMMVAVYDKLVEQDVTGAYAPYLAESFSSNDDYTVWTVTLRSGVTFHNGVALTAQSIVDMFPIQQAGAASAGVVASSGLTSVEATGDLEVTYTLSAPKAIFPSYLARAPLGMVFEAGAAAADPDGFSMAPVGTGPFVIESRDLDNKTVFVRNADYWGSDPDGNQLPYLDSISFLPIPDEGTRLDALLSGTVDAMQTLRQGTIRDARDARDGGAAIELLESQGNNVGGGMFNMAIAPFDDLRVRQGLISLNSQEQVIEALGGTGISLPGTQWFSADSPWWSQKVAEAWPKFNFDAGVEKLNEYINDAARSDGKAVGESIDVELSCPPDPTLIAAMQVLQQTLEATELVNVTMTNYDQQTHINNALGMDNGFQGVHSMHCWRWSSEDDPTAGILAFLSEPTNFPNWTGEYADEAKALAAESGATDDFATRKALFEEIMMIIVDQLPIWYSGHTATAIGTSPAVHGLNGWHVPSGDLGIGFPSAEGRWSEVFISG